MKGGSARKQEQAAAAQNEAILTNEEARAREERYASIRDRVRVRNSWLLRSFGAPAAQSAGPTGGGPSAPTAVGGGSSPWKGSGWRSTSRQGFGGFGFWGR